MKGVGIPRGTGEEVFLSLHESKGAAQARWVHPQQPRARLETAPWNNRTPWHGRATQEAAATSPLPTLPPPPARGSKNRYLGEFSRRF